MLNSKFLQAFMLMLMFVPTIQSADANQAQECCACQCQGLPKRDTNQTILSGSGSSACEAYCKKFCEPNEVIWKFSDKSGPCTEQTNKTKPSDSPNGAVQGHTTTRRPQI